MPTLYASPFSTPALTTLFAAKAVGFAHEVQWIDLSKGEHMSADYKKINPFCKVPALVDGDFHLAESGAIVRYMARKQNAPHYPSDLQAGAEIDQWFDFVAFHIRTPLSRVQFNRMFAERLGQVKDEASIQFGLKILSQSLPQADAQIAKTGFLVGSSCSIADIVLLGTLDPAEALQIDLSPYPALTEWRNTMRKQDFYTQVHSHYGVEFGL